MVPYPSRIAGPSLAPRTTSRSMITPSWTFAAGPVGRPERVQVRGLAALDQLLEERGHIGWVHGRPGSGVEPVGPVSGDPEAPQMACRRCGPTG